MATADAYSYPDVVVSGRPADTQDPDQKSVEVFRKNPQGVWELHPSDAATPAVSLPSIGWSGTIGDLLGE